jgi:hypothetical protein
VIGGVRHSGVCEFPNYLAPFFPRYLARSLSERSDLRWTHLGRQTLPGRESPRPRAERSPDSALLGSAVPGDAFLGFFVDSSGFSLFGRRFVNPRRCGGGGRGGRHARHAVHRIDRGTQRWETSGAHHGASTDLLTPSNRVAVVMRLHAQEPKAGRGRPGEIPSLRFA